MAKKSNGNIQTSIPTGNIYVTPLEEVFHDSKLTNAEFLINYMEIPSV